MYAIIQTGGKQYRVTPGSVIVVEKLPGQKGDTVSFSDILMYGDGDKAVVGSPFVSQASVKATIREQSRGDKVIIFKKKRRQNYRRKKGHIQDITVLQVADILVGGTSTGGAAKPVTEAAVAPRGQAEETVKKTSAQAPKKPAKTKSVESGQENPGEKAPKKAKKQIKSEEN